MGSRLWSVFFLLLVAAITFGALLTQSAATLAISSSITVAEDFLPLPVTPTTALAPTETAAPTPTAVPPTPTEDASPELEAMAAEELRPPMDPEVLKEADLSLQTTMEWNPPPLPVPLARHPYDHYWFMRPLRSNHINTGLIRYPYGSTGSSQELRIHHGIDISNPVGTEVIAVADGVVEVAGWGHRNSEETITSYGNVISIRHDVGYQGKKLYTLYAHLSEILVEPGQRVTAGQVIGLVGATGDASGPHLHFEVRLDRNAYRSVRNPDLWLAPYTGTGVIAGRVTFASGNPVYSLEVVVTDLDTGKVAYRTTTYAGDSARPDDLWNENFAIPNVPVGRYLVTAGYGASAEIEVQEGLTNWVELTLTGASSTDEEE
ncbi:MAG TPA: peptidoglycan DD-metalloendopeptidase family protein [Aggregatilineales bacterium]|nr:peptidoglycan DD-metalloendopeptidase family protein [Aggregatilineales bacterium]HQE18444.1 peptidoglycan DD-metalloendopeptidase family protein [Aggregatilineales bacterium]